ncbi:helix-turn-helix domain-containing protein [Pseudonocardia asaccharolytica]|uniref:Cyclic diguanylate phosphodiesterase n=1 Tax=Pseudonocardia asaccharolytica DSM 44247 = NBRC 16224 TaxID=1123024 RepID=A0A511D080_9PSEU|nr:helix-turn-helix domain-containing protein [Pseudonocardia asaccharolytica]GEL18107.1 cyclic diguanylate phosphodiesterase [Pseudonocardia asaccharolytica DSM 44247 = NBRC 16224]
MEEFLRRLLSARSVGTAAQAAVDTVRTALGVDISWSGVITDGVLTMAAHSGLRTSRMPATWRLPLGEGIGGRVAAEGRALAVRDYRHDPRRAPVMKSLIDEEGMRGALCAPLVHGPEVLGVLYAADRRARDWAPDDFHLVTGLARDTGSAIHRICEVEAASRRSAQDRRLALDARRGLLVATEVAAAMVRSDDLGAGLGVLAHTLGMPVELAGPSGEPLVGQPGADPEEPVRFEVDLGDEPMGRLRVRGGRDLNPTERDLLGTTSEIVALHLLRQRAALRSELRVYAEFLDDLFEGRIDDRPGLQARAALLGIDLRVPRHVVCLGVHTAGPGEGRFIGPQTLDRVERAMHSRYPKAVVVPRSGDVLVLLPPGTEDSRQVHRSLQELVRVRPGTPDTLAAGFGRLCTDVDEYIDSYAEASLALDLARRRAAPGEVLSPRDLGLYGLLVRSSTRQTMESMVGRALGPVLAADADGGPEYVKTLRTYLTNDRHLERTAAALHIHPNTVRYRLARAQELLEVNLRDPDDRFLLELALRVQAALEHG